MRIASVADVKAHFSAFLKDSGQGPVVITRNGRPVAVILPVEDEDEIERLVLAYSPKFQKILSAAREDIRQTGGMRHEDFWREVAAGDVDEQEIVSDKHADAAVGERRSRLPVAAAIGEGKTPHWDNRHGEDG
jgi:prevent-host-death family protein